MGVGWGTNIVVLHLDKKFRYSKVDIFSKEFNGTYLCSNLLNLVNNLCLTKKVKIQAFLRVLSLMNYTSTGKQS